MSAAPFSIGTSSSIVPGAAQSMDMSLGRSFYKNSILKTFYIMRGLSFYEGSRVKNAIGVVLSIMRRQIFM